MKELVMIIRPEKLEDIKKILDEIKCGGMTISTVMGCGTQKGIVTSEKAVNEIRGFKTTINLLPKICVEVAVSYTHLDVYKRQGMPFPERRRYRGCFSQFQSGHHYDR